MYEERLIQSGDPPRLRKYLAAQLKRDLECLRKGAQHLRVMGWFLLIPTSFLSFVLFLYMLMRPDPRNVALFIIMLMLLGVASFYFSISAYIRRARRWAVNIALGVAFIPIILTILLATQPEVGLHKRSTVNLVIESIYSLFHIRMILDLARCLGAVQRIAAAAQLRYGDDTEAAPATEPWERDDRT